MMSSGHLSVSLAIFSKCRKAFNNVIAHEYGLTFVKRKSLFVNFGLLINCEKNVIKRDLHD